MKKYLILCIINSGWVPILAIHDICPWGLPLHSFPLKVASSFALVSICGSYLKNHELVMLFLCIKICSHHAISYIMSALTPKPVCILVFWVGGKWNQFCNYCWLCSVNWYHFLSSIVKVWKQRKKFITPQYVCLGNGRVIQTLEQSFILLKGVKQNKK